MGLRGREVLLLILSPLTWCQFCKRASTEIESSTDRRERWAHGSGPPQEFLQDYCRATANAVVPITQLFATYSTWCSQGGFSPLNVRVLGKELRKRFPAVERKKCMDGGTRQWCYVGVELTQLPYVDQASLLPEDGNVM